MTEFLPRSAWANSGWSRGGAQLTGGKLVGAANHWPGTTQDTIGDPGRASIRNRIRSYWDFHVNTRGWSDIGYNFAGDQGGRVWDLRGLGRVGAHAASASNPDANHEWMGFLFILGDQEEPSPKLIEAYQDWRHDVFLKRWPGRTRMTGHGRAPGVPGAQTSCPGPFVAKLISNGTLTKQSSNGDDTMSWDEDLTPGTPGNDITGLAHRTIPASWQRHAADLLGYAAMGTAWQRNVTFSKPYFPDETEITLTEMHRWNHSRLKRGEDTWERTEAKQDALLDALDGLDTPAVLERIDARYAEAAQQRQEQSERFDAAVAAIEQRDQQVFALVQQIAEGGPNVDAQAVAREVISLFHDATAPDETE